MKLLNNPYVVGRCNYLSMPLHLRMYPQTDAFVQDNEKKKKPMLFSSEDDSRGKCRW